MWKDAKSRSTGSGSSGLVACHPSPRGTVHSSARSYWRRASSARHPAETLSIRSVYPSRAGARGTSGDAKSLVQVPVGSGG